MITDSFGSPSLGEGIALQAQPKDYTAQIMRGIMAGQDRAAKKQAKAKEQDEAYDKELEALRKEIRPVGLVPIYNNEVKRIWAPVIAKAMELRNDKSRKSSMFADEDFQNMLSDARIKNESLKFNSRVLEDTMKKATLVDRNEYDVDLNIIKLIGSGDEDAWKQLVGNDIYSLPEESAFYRQKQRDLIGDLTSAAGKMAQEISPTAIGIIEETTSDNDVYNLLVSGSESKVSAKRIEDFFESWWNSPEVIKQREFNTRRGIDDNTAKENYKNMFKSLFAKQVKQNVSQLREKSQTPEGQQVYKGMTINKGTYGFDPYGVTMAEDYINKLYRSKEDMDRINSLLSDKKYENIGLIKSNTSTQEVIDKLNKMKSIHDKSIDEEITEIKESKSSDKEKNEAIKKIEAKRYKPIWDPAYHASNRKERGAVEKLIVTNDKTKNIVAGLKGITPDTKLEKGQFNTYDGVIDGIWKDGKDWYVDISVTSKYDKQTKKASSYDTKSSVTRSVLLDDDNWNIVVKSLGLSKKEIEGLYDGTINSNSIPKKEEGGLVEPKTISKKFHNKSKNLTKFVYSDGTEEVFNGII
jgi:hypothetical protein